MRMVYNPQSAVKFAIMTAQTGGDVIMEHQGTRSGYCNNNGGRYNFEAKLQFQSTSSKVDSIEKLTLTFAKSQVRF